MKKKEVPTIVLYQDKLEEWIKGSWWDIFGIIEGKQGQLIIISLLAEIIDQLKELNSKN